MRNLDDSKILQTIQGDGQHDVQDVPRECNQDPPTGSAAHPRSAARSSAHRAAPDCHGEDQPGLARQAPSRWPKRAVGSHVRSVDGRPPHLRRLGGRHAPGRWHGPGGRRPRIDGLAGSSRLPAQSFGRAQKQSPPVQGEPRSGRNPDENGSHSNQQLADLRRCLEGRVWQIA